MAPSGGDPYRSPPIIRKRTSFPLLVVFRKLLSLLVTLLFIIVVTVSIPVYLILGIIGFVKKKSRRWTYEDGCCTHPWPISGTIPELAGMILTGNVDIDALNDGIQRVIADSRSNLYKNPSSDVSSQLGKLWDQSSYRLSTDNDLLDLQRQENVLPTHQTTLSLVPEYSHALKNLMSSSLLVTSTAADCAFMCVQRLLCICMNERTCFEMEPHEPLQGWQVHVFGGFIHTAICMSVKFAMDGPYSLLALALRGQNPVWKYLESKDHVLARNRRGPKALTHQGSSSILMDVIPEDGSDGKSPIHRIQRDSSLLKNVAVPAMHRRCWMTIKHPELLLRAEKLLRATTSELYISLIAGSLRNYFREQGILHPPDLAFVAPCTSRGFAPIVERCETNLLSFQLPTSVEGAIPRLWAVQRSVAKVMDGPLLGALTIFQTITRYCLPTAIAKCALRVVYRSHAVYFAFYRVNNNRIASDALIRTMFVFPSLAASVRAAFVFVQHGEGIDVSVSLCNRTFPEPHRVLDCFQRETQLLLDHLSLRLLSLPQITVLPGVPACLRHERTENEVDSDTFGANAYLNQKTEQPEIKLERDYSLEELYQLLDVVQNELDSMRSNPEEGLRSHYIERLTRLEEQMQNFHECISQKLSAENVGVRSGDEEVGDAIASVLAPYREEPGTSGLRRFSREYSRTETSTTSRKSSRASI
nr:uncharacterized protein LOC100909019 [Haemonchus contortus]